MNNETKVNDINRVVQCNRSNDKPWLARIKRPMQYTYMAGMKCKWSRMNVAHAINYLPCGAIITRSRFPNRLTKSGGHLVSIMRLMSRLWSTLVAALLYSISFFFRPCYIGNRLDHITICYWVYTMTPNKWRLMTYDMAYYTWYKNISLNLVPNNSNWNVFLVYPIIQFSA